MFDLPNFTNQLSNKLNQFNINLKRILKKWIDKCRFHWQNQTSSTFSTFTMFVTDCLQKYVERGRCKASKLCSTNLMIFIWDPPESYSFSSRPLATLKSANEICMHLSVLSIHWRIQYRYTIRPCSNNVIFYLLESRCYLGFHTT